MKWLLPPVLLLFCLVAMGLLGWFWPLVIVVPAPYNWLGIVPVAAGMCLGILGALTFKRAKTNIRPFRDADKLVTTGPFRYTRNPMYLALTLVLLGAWILLGSLSPVIGVVAFAVVADRWYIRGEERMLQQKFGAAFETYRVQTRRWL